MRLYNRLGGLLAATGLIIISYHDVLLQAAVEAKEKGMTWAMLVPAWLAVNKIYKAKQFSERDKRWERKLDAIGKAVGAEWDAKGSNPSIKRSAQSSATGSISSWVGNTTARLARPFMISNMRRALSMEKLKSRKLWVAVITAVLVALNDQLELGFQTDTITSFVAIAIGYIVGQGYADGKKAANGGVNDAQRPGDTGSAV